MWEVGLEAVGVPFLHQTCKRVPHAHGLRVCWLPLALRNVLPLGFFLFLAGSWKLSLPRGQDHFLTAPYFFSTSLLLPLQTLSLPLMESPYLLFLLFRSPGLLQKLSL